MPRNGKEGILFSFVINVMEFASKEIISVNPKTPLEELSQLFGFSQLKKVPVIESGKLVGVVNRSRFSRRILETACLG